MMTAPTICQARNLNCTPAVTLLHEKPLRSLEKTAQSYKTPAFGVHAFRPSRMRQIRSRAICTLLLLMVDQIMPAARSHSD